MQPTDSPTATRRSQPRLLIAVGAAAVLLVSSIGMASLSAGRSASETAVQKVVLDVLHAEHELANLPANAAQIGVNASLRGQMVATAKSEINRLYSGPIIDARLETLVAGIELEGTSDGIFVWDGGVRDVAFESTIISGDSAEVKVQATTFLVMSATAIGDRSSPENTGLFTFELSQIGGNWYVTSEDVEYAPGKGP